MTRLAIVVSHPIQYYAPWFAFLEKHTDLTLRVFYLWDFGVNQSYDPGFKKEITWDVDLLAGYHYEFVANISSVPGNFHFRGLNNPLIVSRLKAFDPEVILTFGYRSLTHMRILFSNSLVSIPKILRGDSHRLLPERGVLSALKTVFIGKLFKRYTHFLAVGTANRDYYSYHGVPKEKITFAPHAVDLERFCSVSENEKRIIAEKYKLRLDKKNVLFVGKLEPKKRPLELLSVWKELGAKDASLTIVGSGILEEEVIRAAGEVSLNVIPFVNQSEMPALYDLADLVVLPSFGKYETWGMAVHEAMAMGVPALVSSHVGCGQDLVMPNKTGDIFDAGDKDSFKKKLDELLRTDLKFLGRNAKENVQNNYSYTNATNGLLEAVKGIR